MRLSSALVLQVAGAASAVAAGFSLSVTVGLVVLAVALVVFGLAEEVR